MKLESEEWELAVTQCHDQTFLVTCRYEKCVREIVVRHNRSEEHTSELQSPS